MPIPPTLVVVVAVAALLLLLPLLVGVYLALDHNVVLITRPIGGLLPAAPSEAKLALLVLLILLQYESSTARGSTA